MPPIVDCAQGKTADVSDFPVLAAGAPITDAWMKAVTGWANDTVGIVAQERQYRAAEQGCVDTLRERGVIR